MSRNIFVIVIIIKFCVLQFSSENTGGWVKKMDHSEFTQNICEVLKQEEGKQVKFCEDVKGGIINNAGLFEVDGKKIFVKYANRKNVIIYINIFILDHRK